MDVARPQYQQENMMQEDLWVPIVLFLALAACVCAGLWFRFRGRAEVQQTIRRTEPKIGRR